MFNYHIANVADFLCSERNRLGNKMFMMAASIAAAAVSGYQFVMPKCRTCVWTSKLRDIFVNLKGVPMIPCETERWKPLYEKHNTKYTRIKTSSLKNLAISGYRQSWKYFGSQLQRDAVRKMFHFAPRFEENAEKTLASANKMFSNIKELIFIGLHMRLNDSVKHWLGFRVANESFYITVLKKASMHFNRANSTIFIATSDSPNSAKRKLERVEHMYNIFWLNGSSGEEVMAVLSKCNHSIISGGTFGFWAAWLAGGTTFYFDKYCRPNTYFAKFFISKNFYLPEWIPVSWS